MGGISNSTENSELQNQLVKSVLKGWTSLLASLKSLPTSITFWICQIFLTVNAFLIPNFHALCLETLASFPFNKMQKSGISYFTHIFSLTLTHGVISSMT